MLDIYEIEFKPKRKEMFSSPSGLELEQGDFVIVEADRGQGLGRVAYPVSILRNRPEKPKRILRKA